MARNPELAALRAKIRDRVDAIWERLWEGEGRLNAKHFARWRRAESLIAAKERAAAGTVVTPPD